jgi:transcriptional antiterminator RfaH
MNTANKNWLLVRYKINEHLRFEKNLSNQSFDFYIPRIFTNIQEISHINKRIKEEVLFPGYGFVRMAHANLQALKYTLGLINIVKFGDQYAVAKNSLIHQLKELEYSSKIQPIFSKRLAKGDIVSINSGPFKGNISKILATPAKDRVTILISLLGSERTLTLSADQLHKF